jgi:hypothetical protein
MAVAEQELLDGQRAFAMAQALLGSPVARRLGTTSEVGWYGTSIDDHEGSFAVVASSGPFADEVGETLRVTEPSGRFVFAYVVRAAAVPTDLALARRAFLHLGLLSLESLRCTIEVCS